MPELLMTVAGIIIVIALASATGSAISSLMARIWPAGVGEDPAR